MLAGCEEQTALLVFPGWIERLLLLADEECELEIQACVQLSFAIKTYEPRDTPLIHFSEAFI
jgi:hypothetical protein